jgi:hypothetical protein
MEFGVLVFGRERKNRRHVFGMGMDSSRSRIGAIKISHPLLLVVVVGLVFF